MARKKAAAVAETIPMSAEEIKRLASMVQSEMWPIDDVLFDPNNANKHDRRSIEDIRASIAKFGQVEPLLIRKSTSVLIAGEGRLLAMKELGFAHVEVKPLPVDATTAAMLSLALNQTAKASHFDFENVAAQLKGFKADNHDISILGWSEVELSRLIGNRPNGEVVEDPKGEWEGMPEFENEAKEPLQTILVHFHSENAVKEFSRVIGQEVKKTTKYINLPFHPGLDLMPMKVVDEP